MIIEYAQNEVFLVIDGQPVAPTEDYSIRLERAEAGPCRAVLYHKDQPVTEPHRFLTHAQTRAPGPAA